MAKIPAHLISNGGPDNSGQRGSWQVDGDTGASAMYGAVKDGGNQVSRTSASVYSAMAVLDENQDRTEQIQFSKYLKEKKSSLDVEMANPTNEISKNHKIWDHLLDEYRSEIENYISDSGLNPDVVNPMLDHHYKLTADDYAIKRNKLRATEQMEAFNTQNELLLTMNGISDEQLKSELVKNATSFKSVLGNESDKFISNVDNFIDSQRFNQHVVADGIGTYQRINAKKKYYGKRQDGSNKGQGYFGEMKMTDGSGDVMTENSITIPFENGDVDMPTIVPTLSKDELNWLLDGNDVWDGSETSKRIIEKSVAHAKKRKKEGLSPFSDSIGEEEDGEFLYYKNLTSEQRADAIVKATKERNRIQVEEQDEIDQLWGEMDRAGDLDEPSKLDSYQRLLEDKKKSGLIDGTFYKREIASVERTKKGLAPKYDEYSEELRSEILQGLDPARRSTHYEAFKRLDSKKLTPAIREAIKKDINEIIDPEEAASGVPDQFKRRYKVLTQGGLNAEGKVVDESWARRVAKMKKYKDHSSFNHDSEVGGTWDYEKLYIELSDEERYMLEDDIKQDLKKFFIRNPDATDEEIQAYQRLTEEAAQKPSLEKEAEINILRSIRR